MRLTSPVTRHQIRLCSSILRHLNSQHDMTTEGVRFMIVIGVSQTFSQSWSRTFQR